MTLDHRRIRPEPRRCDGCDGCDCPLNGACTKGPECIGMANLTPHAGGLLCAHCIQMAPGANQRSLERRRKREVTTMPDIEKVNQVGAEFHHSDNGKPCDACGGTVFSYHVLWYVGVTSKRKLTHVTPYCHGCRTDRAPFEMFGVWSDDVLDTRDAHRAS